MTRKARRKRANYLKLELCDDAYAAIDGADGVVILTEWNEFRALDLAARQVAAEARR